MYKVFLVDDEALLLDSLEIILSLNAALDIHKQNKTKPFNPTYYTSYTKKCL